ncbi:calcium:proton antiporter [Bradyrhizobium australiense]|uniref:Ionic transporter y4hA n=1 Tax=Bradyrhizobium australiense TaxID=2721161 RepID=A0A7Y4LUL0_9BRAD|nr:ionic transporter y4hA [Bradyrhizobium australiense]NOJ39119.1 ionic transporter y4hA [Bradyrhizobium australiense]
MTAMRSAWWTWAWPLLSWIILTLAFAIDGGGLVAAIAGITLLGTVFTAVYHAEVIAHRLGEPFGTLVLALAVTIIETALIVSVMLAAPADKAGLARDTVFAAVMIVCNGIVGFCLLIGGARHHEQGFQLQGASAALAVLAALTFLALILPNYAATELGSAYNTPQLVFAGLVSLVLYGAFLFIQTVRHRDFFLPVQLDDEEKHELPPSSGAAALSAGLLLISLVGIVGLAKVLTPTVEFAVARLDVPKAVVGVIIAALVLLPEALAASRAARMNRLQTSLNLALGSALATIGLTIPAVAAVSIVLGQRLQLGLDTKDQGLLAVTLLLSVITLGTGRTTVLQGIVHLVTFAAFMFFAVVP